MKLRKFSGIQRIKEPESTGAADGNVQAFNYRTILSSDPANRLPNALRAATYAPEFAPAHLDLAGVVGASSTSEPSSSSRLRWRLVLLRQPDL